MSAPALKKNSMSPAYPAASNLFEQLARIFASPSPGDHPKLKTKQLDASLKALRKAPIHEVSAVSQILDEISARVRELNNHSESINEHRDHATSRTSVPAETAARNEDSMIRNLLADRREQSVESELTSEQEQVNAQVMSRLRREAAAALQRRIDNKELLTSKEFQEALGISRQSINEAVRARRMFALLGPGGENYYPAFYADADLHRREVEKVAKVLGGLPPASKYHFFTSKSTFLGAATPLEALKKGRLDDVLIAATATGDR